MSKTRPRSETDKLLTELLGGVAPPAGAFGPRTTDPPAPRCSSPPLPTPPAPHEAADHEVEEHGTQPGDDDCSDWHARHDNDGLAAEGQLRLARARSMTRILEPLGASAGAGGGGAGGGGGDGSDGDGSDGDGGSGGEHIGGSCIG